MSETLGLRVSAKAVIEAEGAILILHPSAIDANRRWHIPGGIRDDVREPLRETANREIWEEAKIDLTGVPSRVFKIGEWTAVDHGEKVGILAVFFHFKLDKRPPVDLTENDEHDDSAWINRRNYLDYDTNPEVREIVEELFSEVA